MRIRKIVGTLHLWLGLLSGAIVLFLGLTGCILAFEREIEEATQPYRFVKKQNVALLQPSQIQKIAERQLPQKKLHSIGYQQGHSAVAVFFDFQPNPYYYAIYINPYNGVVLKVKDMSKDFFRIVINGHYYLWLPPKIGQPIVASATLVFVVMLVSGIILWWPRHKVVVKQRLTIKWSARWRRVNYDLHNVLGFYMTWIALFIALTGLIMGFQWMSKSVYWLASGGQQQVQYTEASSGTSKYPGSDHSFTAMDHLWKKTLKGLPGFTGIVDVHPPASRTSAVEIAVNPDAGTYWQTDYHYYDQYTLREIEVKHSFGKLASASTADKLLRMNYDIHVGAIAGLPGKVVAFFASLIAASLPVTGFLLWRGRKKKHRKKIAWKGAPATRLETPTR